MSMQELIEESHAIVDEAIATHAEGRDVVATVVLFSGGNDSTVLAHLMRQRATHAAHANTGIGIEATRQFVRDTCAGWGLPLIEKHPPAGSTYRELVLDQGFPGPAQHWKMYQRLKERCLRQVRRDLVTDPRRQRVLFLAGRRRDESSRRAMVPEMERTGSVIWASPLVGWSKLDLNAYRRANPDCPRNEVADTLHMSGECLCGAFAKRDELDEIGWWFPEVEAHIRDLEEQARAARPDLPAHRCRWGWGGEQDAPALKAVDRQYRSGLLCSSCEHRHEAVAR